MPPLPYPLCNAYAGDASRHIHVSQSSCSSGRPVSMGNRLDSTLRLHPKLKLDEVRCVMAASVSMDSQGKAASVIRQEPAASVNDSLCHPPILEHHQWSAATLPSGSIVLILIGIACPGLMSSHGFMFATVVLSNGDHNAALRHYRN